MFGQWIEDCCDAHLGNREIWDRSADLFDSWTEYAQKAGEDAGTKTSFGLSMRKRGFEKDRIKGVRAFRRVRLKLDTPPGGAFDYKKRQANDDT